MKYTFEAFRSSFSWSHIRTIASDPLSLIEVEINIEATEIISRLLFDFIGRDCRGRNTFWGSVNINVFQRRRHPWLPRI